MENARIAASHGIAGPAAGIGGSEVMSLTGDRTKSDREKISILSNEFESLFLSRMLSSMRSSVQKSDFLSGGSAEKMFTGMMDDELARQMAFGQSGGLSNALERQLSALMGLGMDEGKNEISQRAKNRYSHAAATPIDKKTEDKESVETP